MIDRGSLASRSSPTRTVGWLSRLSRRPWTVERIVVWEASAVALGLAAAWLLMRG